MMFRPGPARCGGCLAMPRCATPCARGDSRARLASAMIEWHAQPQKFTRESSTCNLRTLVRISPVVVHSFLTLLYRTYASVGFGAVSPPQRFLMADLGGEAAEVGHKKNSWRAFRPPNLSYVYDL